MTQSKFMEEENRGFLHTPMKAEDIHSLWHQKLLEVSLLPGRDKISHKQGGKCPTFV